MVARQIHVPMCVPMCVLVRVTFSTLGLFRLKPFCVFVCSDVCSDVCFMGLEQGWNRVGTGLEPAWNGVGTGLDLHWNRVGSELEASTAFPTRLKPGWMLCFLSFGMWDCSVL